MQRSRYTTADNPARIAHEAIRDESRKLTYAEEAANTAITEAIEQAGASACLADGILARAGVAAATPYIAAATLQAAHAAVIKHSKAAAMALLHLSNEFDPGSVASQRVWDPERWDLKHDHARTGGHA
ncbi:hypothetical protein LO763_22220 [Glycomyces sp. A-F 0318]|uniref:hypothetical protein n=1 Tax=Glycomyces amatae TaxID=2881355 RepID=UPI001E387B8E|nr:hypothetical protein [Glycomyces amatae]MCD0446334.1 hypothetical protein [Glycomyces amatae]